jgi:hypothetical protein
MDGEIEINAHLPNITETVGLEVFGANYAAVMTNAGLALAAFASQATTLVYDSFLDDVLAGNLTPFITAYLDHTLGDT